MIRIALEGHRKSLRGPHLARGPGVGPPCSRRSGVPVSSLMLWLVHDSTSLHQGLLPDIGVGTSAGVRLLQYLEDWLAIAKSMPPILHHHDLLLQLCQNLGIVINWEKSGLQPSNRVQYLMVIDTSRERVFTSDASRLGSRVSCPPFSSCEDMVTAVGPHGLPGVISSQGSLSVRLGDPSPRSDGVRVWSQEESFLHTSVLGMQALMLELATLLPQLSGQCVVLMSDDTTVVVHLRNQGGTVSWVMCHMASKIVQWIEFYSVILSTRCIPGKRNGLVVLAEPSRGVVSLTEGVQGDPWGFQSSPSQSLCDLSKCQTTSVHVSSPRPDGMEAGHFPTLLGQPVGLLLSTFCSSLAGIVESSAFDRALIGPSGSVVASERVVRQYFVLVGR